MVVRCGHFRRVVRRVVTGAGLLWLAAWSGAVAAQEQPFTVTPTLTARTTFTDNVGLDPSDEAISDMIFEVSPGISATAEGNRVSGQANYRLRNLYYLREDERNRATHLFSLDGSGEVLEDFFFVDASAQRRDQAFSLVDPAGLAGGVGENEATEVTTWRLSPYVTQRLGRFATLTARYAHNRTAYARDGARDQYTNTYSANMSSGSLFGRFFWSGNYSRRETSYQQSTNDPLLDDEVTFETASVTAGWDLTRSFRVFGTVGEERNDYSSGFGDRDGSFWSAGFNLSPSRNTTLEATTGERFYGDTYSLSLQHRRRRTLLEASYQETIVTNQRQTLANTEEFFEIIGEAEGELTLEDFLVTREEVSVLKRAQASVTLDLRRSQWTLTGFRTQREFLQTVADDDRDQTQTGVQGSLSWQLGPTVSWDTSLRYARVRYEDDRQETLRSGRTGLRREFGPNVNGSLFYRHQQRSADGDGREFRENAITATVDMSF